MLLLLRDEESESEDSETGNYGEVDDLGEVGGTRLLPVGEGDIEVEGPGAIGIELELSSSSGGSEGRVAVLDTGEGDPEVSGDALALAPLRFGDFLGNVWLSVGGVLNGLFGGEASSVVCHLIELPSVELVIFANAILSGPGNVEVFSERLIVDSI